MIGGMGRLKGRSVIVIGQEKGHDTQSRVKHNFGMARPEGYRKAQRLMDLADRFGLPVITLVDTAGAYPGIGAEERGQAEAIARSIESCLNLKVPIVSLVIGEAVRGCYRHRCSRPYPDAGTFCLFGHLAGGLCVDTLAGRQPCDGSSECVKADRAGSDGVGGYRRDRRRARRRRSSPSFRNHQGRRRGDLEKLAELIGVDGAVLRQQRREKFLKMGEAAGL